MKGYVLKFFKESLSKIKTIFSSCHFLPDRFSLGISLNFWGFKVSSLIFEQYITFDFDT